MSPLAIAFAVLAHGTPSDLGYVLAAGTAPLVVFLLVGGVIADRLGQRVVMLSADALRFVAQAVLGGWLIAGGAPLWGFMLLEALVGVGTGLFSPALTGLIPGVVGDEQLQQANALNGLASSGGRIIGPALAGVIVAATSPGWAITADAASFLVSVVCLSSLHLTPKPMRESSSFIRELIEGWTEFWSRTWLWVVVVQYSICNVLIVGPFIILGAVIAKDSLGGASVWGAILACEAVGAVLGGIVLLRYKPHRPLLVATAVTYAWVLPLVALAFRIAVPLIALGAVFGGFSLSTFSGLWETTLQRNVPSAVLSRVSAYDWLGSLVLLPIGEAAIGPLSKLLGIRTTLVGAAIFLAFAVTIVLLVPSVNRLRSEIGQKTPT
jgi:MFS family permease